MTETNMHIQLHDATLTDLRILSGGQVMLRFDGVTVYRRPVASKLYDMWIHRAKLIANHVTEVSVLGAWVKDDDDYVLTDTILANRSAEIHWTDLEAEELQSIDLILFSGAHQNRL